MKFFYDNIAFIKKLIIIVLLVIIIVLLMITRPIFRYRRVFNENHIEKFAIEKASSIEELLKC